jgi:hypothetical protein
MLKAVVLKAVVMHSVSAYLAALRVLLAKLRQTDLAAAAVTVAVKWCPGGLSRGGGC